MNADEVHQLLQRLQQEGFAAVQPGLDEDDKQPYEKRYQQAAALQVQIQALSGPGSPPGAAEPLDLAALRVQRGVVLLETDLLPEAEASVAAGLATLEQAVGALQPPQEDAAAPPPQQVALAAAQGEHVVLLQAAYNGLGALWSRRGDLPAALAWLTKAETLASWAIAEARRLAAAAAPEQQRPPAENGHAPGAPGEGRPSDAAETPAAPLDGWAAAAEELEAGFTTTLFFLAQVHGHAADRHRSAHYCAATLQRQLLPPAAAALNRSEWVQNCVQLAGFYVAEGALGVARHCLAAARLVAAGLPNNSAPGAGEPPGSDPPPQPPQPAVEPPDWGHMVVDSDVVANLRLAHAKLHREALRRAHAAHVLGQPAPGPAQDEAPLQAPAFASLAPHLPPAPAGEEAEEPQQLAGSFEAARELFNRGMTEYNAALGFYQLDGWVTEHVNILLETSGLLRWLADFEPDARRQAAMHKLRAGRLEPVAGGALSAEHFLELVRAVELESGNAWRDCMAARGAVLEESRRQGAAPKQADVKAAAVAAQTAAKHYQAALRTWHEPGKQTFPGRVAPEEEEALFLTTCFSLGRVLHRCLADGGDGDPNAQVALLAQARDHLEWSAKYVARHKVVAFEKEAALALDLAHLIVEKINLQQRLART